MSLGLLVILVALAALGLTVLTGMFSQKVDNWLVSYLQHFTGSLFLFSGAVKAVDPMGTAFKMQDYFGAFQGTFEPTWFSFLAPLFAGLSDYSLFFSVTMIVLEILLGIMLILGSLRRFTSWAFFLLVAFFTVLTGYTYLTGYVPTGVNFFQFSEWEAFQATNMKVTDCGCFGDFLKLEPRTSFLKDVFLLVPALIFLFFWPRMHQLFSRSTRSVILLVAAPALVLYCMSNYAWNLPDFDFRAFKEGVNVRERKAIEVQAMENVEVVGYRLREKEGDRVVELPLDRYLAEFKDYPKEDWELEQIQSEPAVEPTKISDFLITDPEGTPVTDRLLEEPGYSLMVVAYTIEGEARSANLTVTDTLWRQDTVRNGDSIQVLRVVDRTATRQVTGQTFTWPDTYLRPWTEVLNPVLREAEAAGVRVYAVVGGAGADKIEDFRHATQSAYPFYAADDILLKTIIRSNPGILLWKDGVIVKKWHLRKLPDFEAIQADFLVSR